MDGWLRQFYHPLHSQIQTFHVARLTRALSSSEDVLVIERKIIGDFINASVNDQSEAKRLLNANPSLHTATWLGDEPIVMFLAIENFANAIKFCVENGFDVNGGENEFNDTPLHNACKLNYPDAVRVLCELGADTNATSIIDATPLHCCIDHANSDIIDTLIIFGADPCYVTDLGYTIFDNWPNCATKQASLRNTLYRHGVKKNAG